MKRFSKPQFWVVAIYCSVVLACASLASAEDLMGYIDTQGNMVIEPQWDYADHFTDDGIARVFIGTLSYDWPDEGQFGFINREGQWISEPQWTGASPFSNGLAVVQKNDKYGYIDTHGNVIWAPQWDYASSFSDQGFALVFHGTMKYGSPDKGRYSLLNKAGVVVDLPWEHIELDRSGLMKIKENEKYGFVNVDGKIISDPQWESVYGFTNGIAPVCQDGKWGYIDIQGKVINQPQWDEVYWFYNGVAAVCQDGKWGYIDTEGNVIIKPRWDYAKKFNEEGTALVFNGTLGIIDMPDKGVHALIDKKGDFVTDARWKEVFYFSEGLAVVRKDGKEGYIDAQGNEAIVPQWDKASFFTEDGIAWVFNGIRDGLSSMGKYGFINKKGELISDLLWTDIGSFSEGLVAVQRDDKFGFMDVQGNLVIEPQFSKEAYFHNGLAAVTVPSKYDFKKLTWGASREEVIASEGAPEGEGEMTDMAADYIYYERTLCGLEAVLTYYLSSDKLYAARYVLQEKHTGYPLYIKDYEDIRETIIEKHDSPLSDDESWYGDSKWGSYQNDKAGALSAGYLTFETIFDLPRTTIKMNMSADNDEVLTSVEFQSKDVKPGAKKKSLDF